MGKLTWYKREQIAQADYVKFEKGDQTRFLRIVKEKNFTSWNDLATFLGVNRSMVFLYLSEKSRLPFLSFNKLAEVSGLDVGNFSYNVVPCLPNINVKTPKLDSIELAEFVGIMLGDGCSQKRTYQITISGGTIDGSFISEYIPTLIEYLFSKKVRFRKMAKESFDCIFNSKEVHDMLFKRYNFSSPKTNCEIPCHFFDNPSLLKACVRGLFDTDGGLHKHHVKSAQLHFTNKSKSLIKSLRRALIHLGFKPSRSTINHKEKCTWTIYLFSEDVKKYHLEIGFKNPKNIIKYERWIETGIVPLNSEIEADTRLPKEVQEQLLGKKLDSLKIYGYGAKK